MTIQNHIFLTILAASCSLFCASCNRNDCPPPPQCPPQTNDSAAAAAASTPVAATKSSDNVPSAETAANALGGNSQANPLASPDAAAGANANKPIPPETQAAKEEAENDSEEEEDEEVEDEEEVCEETEEEGFDPNLRNELAEFSRRHEVQGDLSEAKWADLEPTLPVSVLKVAPDQDVIKKLNAMFEYNCSFDLDGQGNALTKTSEDGSSVQLIFCSQKDRRTFVMGKVFDDEERKYIEKKKEAPRGFYLGAGEMTGDDKEICQTLKADAAYVSLVSPKDHYTRVYEIDISTLEFGYAFGGCVSESESGSLSLIDVESRPFMEDTTGLYVRTLESHHHGVEHAGDSSDDSDASYTTWLFAGDNHRLVTSWEDTSYSYEEAYEQHGRCTRHSLSETYKESYMYYEAGEFKQIESLSASDNSELIKLLLGRP